jgi:predicted Zn-dependent protease
MMLRICVCMAGLLLGLSNRTVAQRTTTPLDSTRLTRALRETLKELHDLEIQTAGAMSGRQTQARMARTRPLVERRAQAEARARALLDTALFQTRWGVNELVGLRKSYPGSTLLLDYEARLASDAGRLADARDIYARLLRSNPTDLALQSAYASTLERLGDLPAARTGYARWLELAPNDADAFRALVRLSRGPEELDELLARLRRLQQRVPNSQVLKEHTIELLYKLGRTSEADSAVRALKERKS